MGKCKFQGQVCYKELRCEMGNIQWRQWSFDLDLEKFTNKDLLEILLLAQAEALGVMFLDMD